MLKLKILICNQRTVSKQQHKRSIWVENVYEPCSGICMVDGFYSQWGQQCNNQPKQYFESCGPGSFKSLNSWILKSVSFLSGAMHHLWQIFHANPSMILLDNKLTNHSLVTGSDKGQRKFTGCVSAISLSRNICPCSLWVLWDFHWGKWLCQWGILADGDIFFRKKKKLKGSHFVTRQTNGLW